MYSFEAINTPFDLFCQTLELVTIYCNFFLSCWCEFVDRSVGYIRIVFRADDCPDIKNNKLMIKSIRFIILGHLMFVRQKCVIIRILLIVKPKTIFKKRIISVP